jgi:formyltetrahydrofolate deformylase
MLDEFTGDESRADIKVVIGNHSTLEWVAEQYDVPYHDIGDQNGVPDEDRLLKLLSDYEIDLIALARYIRILSPDIVFRFRRRIINVHPSLLPALPGASAYSQAIDEGVRITGVTAHYVTPDLDQGPIITQRAFNVPDDATKADLREKGQPLEADALVEAVKLHLENSLTVREGRTYLRDEAESRLGLPDEIEWLNPSGPTDRGTSASRQYVSLTRH